MNRLSPPTQAQRYITTYINATDTIMDQLAKKQIDQATTIHPLVSEAWNRFFQINNKGKRIRGALSLAAFEICGGTDLAAMNDASTSIELLQTGLLIHDDIMDRDLIRRGLPTIHEYFRNKTNNKLESSHYGVSMAINIGDAALFLACQQLVGSKFPSEYKSRALEEFTTKTIEVIAGQEMDITEEKKIRSETDILRIYLYKTASYTGILPMRLGAILAGVRSESLMSALTAYGKYLGLVFQLQDDLLGIFGDTLQTGKSNQTDIINKKQTLILALAYAASNRKDKNVLDRLFEKTALLAEDIAFIRSRMVQTRAVKKTQECIHEYLQKAAATIPKITRRPTHQKLLESFLSVAARRDR